MPRRRRSRAGNATLARASGQTGSLPIWMKGADDYDPTVGKPTQTRQPMIPSSSLVASVVKYPGGKAPRIYQGAKKWQREAYRHYGICGEARYAANLLGAAMSRTDLFVELPTDKGWTKAPPTDKAQVQLDAVFNGSAGRAQMMRALEIHLTIAGDCYLVGRSADTATKDGFEVGVPQFTDGRDIWEVVSVLEMNVQGDTWTIKYDDTRLPVELDDEDIVIRIWRPSPEKRVEADSPFRSLLPTLTEIEWATMHIFAQCRSRLAGAGLMFINSDISFPKPPPQYDADNNEIPMDDLSQASQFMYLLAEAMMTAIGDQGSADAIMPVIASIPGDKIENAAKLMHFWSEIDEKAMEIRKDGIHRFALGMNLPPERVLGMSANAGTGGGTSNGVSHWGAWQIEEDTIKLHVEPDAQLIADAICLGWIWVSADTTDCRVSVNTAELRLRPDRSKEAIQMWDRLWLSDEALGREVGFDNEDMAGDDQIRMRILRKIAMGSATPEQVAAANALLGIDLPIPGALPQRDPREQRPDPSVKELPTRDIPERPPGDPINDAAALEAASNALCFRALERVGNRLRTSVGKPIECRSFEVHTLVKANGNAGYVMNDAFSCAPEILDGIADPAKVVPVLETYVTSLITEQSPHEKTRLSKWLAVSGLT